MFWNCLHLANLHSHVDGEEVPHLIVGLHSEVCCSVLLTLQYLFLKKRILIHFSGLHEKRTLGRLRQH